MISPSPFLFCLLFYPSFLTGEREEGGQNWPSVCASTVDSPTVGVTNSERNRTLTQMPAIWQFHHQPQRALGRQVSFIYLTYNEMLSLTCLRSTLYNCTMGLTKTFLLLIQQPKIEDGEKEIDLLITNGVIFSLPPSSCLFISDRGRTKKSCSSLSPVGVHEKGSESSP